MMKGNVSLRLRNGLLKLFFYRSLIEIESAPYRIFPDYRESMDTKVALPVWQASQSVSKLHPGGA